MSHSTHVGFKAPIVVPSIKPTTTVSGSDPVAFGARFAPLIVRQSRLTGVGQYIAAAGKPLRGWVAIWPRFSAAFLRGVGHEPPSVPSVGSANGTRWYTFPASIIPERGKVSENVSQSETKDAWHVLSDDKAGS